MSADAVGGVWTYALDLARGLVAHDMRTTLAVLGPAPHRDQRAAALSVPGLDLVETDLPLDWTAEAPETVIAAGEALAVLAGEVGADIVHLNSPALGAGVSFPVPVVAICHSCAKTWWAAMRSTALPADFAWRADLVARGYDRAAILLAPTRAFARVTASAYGLHREPRVVPNGRPPPAPHTMIGPGADVVFTAGRLWDEGKNIALLDAAAARLGLQVLAAGPLEGPNGARIALRSVRALGTLNAAEMADRLSGRPIFVSPALYEPFGLAVLEAAHHGCPLVLSDIASFRELWDDAATFVDPRDASGLAQVVEGLARDPARRMRLGRAAALRARRYTCGAMVAGTLRAYRQALGDEGAHSPDGELRSRAS